MGASSVLAFAPIGYFPLIAVSFAWLYIQWSRIKDTSASPKQGAISGWLFGSGFFLAGVSWIYVSLSTFGGMPMPIAAAATVLFCLLMALYPALAGGAFIRLAPEKPWQRILVFASLWTLTEWLRGWFLTGFPWLAAGYSQTPPSPLAGFAPITGVYGLSFLMLIIAGCLGEIVLRLKGTSPCDCKNALLAAIALICGTGIALNKIDWVSPTGKSITVALLQGNVAQETKWDPAHFQHTLVTYYRLMRDHPADLTVMPETALPVFYQDVPPAYLEELTALTERTHGNLIFGVPDGNLQRYTNSAMSLGQNGAQRYDKVHLVPFGEFIPDGFAWFMTMANIPMSQFSRGEKQQAPMHIGKLRAAINICYEDAFGEEIIRAVPEANLLINISNVAWFGDSLAPAQHLQISTLRAMESGRPMLRATNTGMTAIIAPNGHVTAKLPAFTQAALSATVEGYAGSTPFVQLGGNMPIIVLCTLCLIGFRNRKKAF